MVFRRLLDLPAYQNRLQYHTDQKFTSAQRDRLAVLALLHDFGKANLGFQDKPFHTNAAKAGHIRETAPLFNEPRLAEKLAHALELNTLSSWFSSPKALQGHFFALLSHHGAPLHFNDLGTSAQNYYLAKTIWWLPQGERDPFDALTDLMHTARHAFPAAFHDNVPPIPDKPRLQHRFAGLLMLADWIGSDERFFPIDDKPDRYSLAPKAAAKAIMAIGLEASDWQAKLATNYIDFEGHFPFPPRPLQAALDQLPTGERDYRLLIAEAETGSGKTEAALARFFRLFAAGEVAGLYFALPTRVAARELYRRVLGHIESLFPDPDNRPPVLLAVPGYAEIGGTKVLPRRDGRTFDDPTQWIPENFWSAEHPKRFLAATIAVGTIDQALLSAIQTRHAHLRSVCLDRQLLVVDEVHASDTYMSYLLAELLRHHLQGGHALLLSATLGAEARSRFLNAAGLASSCPDLATATSSPYPALMSARGLQLKMEAPGKTYEKPVTVKCLPYLEHPDSMLASIADALSHNARILVVCNTVGQALAMQKACETNPDIPENVLFSCLGVITPHHGRYAPADREFLDAAVSSRFGENSKPGPLLLIGTQTLEQSLDIDADLLITDLCPMDVLLQRIGRLHRHSRRERPVEYEQARCLLRVPDVESLETWLQESGEVTGAAKRLGLGSVYPDLRSLQRTWEMLREQPQISLPRDNRVLVEMATHSESLERLSGERWQRHAANIEGGSIAQNVRAHHIALARHYDTRFGEFSFNELDKNVRTRLGLGSLRLSLPKPAISSFGIEIKEMVIPGHMAPDTRDPEITELEHCESSFHFRVAGRHYRYTRMGLELTPTDGDAAPA